MSSTLQSPRVQRLRHEIVHRELQVARVDSLGPNLRSVVFTGAALDGFVSASFDDHVKLFLDDGGDGVRRDYTPRRYDAAARELTIEFDLHATGPAARWAAQAQPGQRATIAGPRGSFVIAPDHDWHLLVGDETALPAIARRLEELPADTRAIVVLQVADPADRRVLPSAAEVDLHWVADAEALIAAVRALPLPAGEGYVWCAGEAAAMAALRRVLVDEKGHPRDAVRAAAYWKRGASAHHENLEA
ncbi:MAG TPA: siderophore-interacting protein [Burkholderiaceae bacterium]|jgi:NADPH-dependent ferric siderophore reductase|nr:siderophore-interacting protein [Burkholderiaceae bacterium]